MPTGDAITTMTMALVPSKSSRMQPRNSSAAVARPAMLLLLLSWPAAAVLAQQYAGSSDGAAVRALSVQQLEDVAASSAGVISTASELQQLLASDKAMSVDTDNNLVAYSCGFANAAATEQQQQQQQQQQEEQQSDVAAASANVAEFGQLPDDPDPAPALWSSLHSRRGSNRTFLLDFTGCRIPSNFLSPAAPIVQTAFDTDGNPAVISDAEKVAIGAIWRAVAADFADLDVDVTTDVAGTTIDDIFRTTPSDNRYGQRVCIGGVLPGIKLPAGSDTTGFSYLSTFDRVIPFPERAWDTQPAFVFSSQLVPESPGQASLVAKAISHQLGHVLGLKHDGCVTQAVNPELYEGIQEWAPIMGNPAFRRYSSFDRGNYVCSTNSDQDDYLTMTRQGFLSWVPADVIGDGFPSALPLCINSSSSCFTTTTSSSIITASTRGAISARSVATRGFADKDLVWFTAGAGPITASVTVVPPVRQSWSLEDPLPDPWYRSKLSYTLEILDASGTRLAPPVTSTWQASSTLRAVAAAPGGSATFFIRLVPVAVQGQPGVYGVQGRYELDVQFTAPDILCPRAGLPICVQAITGTAVLPPEQCITNEVQWCLPLANTTVTCRYFYKQPEAVCRPTAPGGCDIPEFCTGSDADCPADLVQNSSYICRAATNGGCDVDEFCPGDGYVCPRDSFKPNTTVCRDSVDICDATEFCTGVGPDCPKDSRQPATFVCRPEAGNCDVPEFCDGTKTSCPPDGFKTPGTVCRPSASPCDEEETCPGFGPNCRPDVVKPSFQICRPVADACDLPERCNGRTGDCPADLRKPDCVVCPRVGLPLCVNPVSGKMVPKGTPCKSDSTSFSLSVPLTQGVNMFCRYQLRPSSFTCRPRAGECDVAEKCTGRNTGCPVDKLAANTVVCRGGRGACDVPEFCSGRSLTCPDNVVVANGTACTRNPPVTYAANSTAPRNATPLPTWTSCGQCSGGVCDMSQGALLWCWS